MSVDEKALLLIVIDIGLFLIACWLMARRMRGQVQVQGQVCSRCKSQQRFGPFCHHCGLPQSLPRCVHWQGSAFFGYRARFIDQEGRRHTFSFEAASEEEAEQKLKLQFGPGVRLSRDMQTHLDTPGGLRAIAD